MPRPHGVGSCPEGGRQRYLPALLGPVLLPGNVAWRSQLRLFCPLEHGQLFVSVLLASFQSWWPALGLSLQVLPDCWERRTAFVPSAAPRVFGSWLQYGSGLACCLARVWPAEAPEWMRGLAGLSPSSQHLLPFAVFSRVLEHVGRPRGV